MRNFRDQNYYELLDILKYATQQEVNSSYQKTCRYLHSESVAMYSLFQPDELELLRKRIDEAYKVLRNPESRRKYDQDLAGLRSSVKLSQQEPTVVDLSASSTSEVNQPVEPTIDSTDPQPNPQEELAGPSKPPESPPEESLSSTGLKPNRAEPANQTPPPKHDEPDTNAEQKQGTPAQKKTPVDQPVPNVFATLPVDENTQYTGEFFRKTREARGLTLEKVSEQTKISIFYLTCLENEQFSDLPAKVYVKGYLKQISKIIGLNPETSVSGYMSRMK